MQTRAFYASNIRAFNALRDFADATTGIENIIILGSVGLISHTQRVGYFRKIKDIDTIVDSHYQQEIEHRLRKKGYQKSTFINQNMPFSNALRKHADTRYTRFYKENSADIEILFTPFIIHGEAITLESFPSISASLPISELQTTSLHRLPIRTFSPELILAIKRLADRTVGRFYTIGKEKRQNDSTALQMMVDEMRCHDVITKLRLSWMRMSIPFIPALLRKS